MFFTQGYLGAVVLNNNTSFGLLISCYITLFFTFLEKYSEFLPKGIVCKEILPFSEQTYEFKNCTTLINVCSFFPIRIELIAAITDQRIFLTGVPIQHKNKTLPIAKLHAVANVRSVSY